MEYYLAIIGRGEFSSLIKFGAIKVSKENFESIEDCEQAEERVIVKLLRSIPNFEYSSEYLFILSHKKPSKGVINIRDIHSLVPFDKSAREEFEFSFNKKIRIDEPRFEPIVRNFMKKQYIENGKKGVDALFEMKGLKNLKNDIKKQFPNNLSEEVFDWLLTEDDPKEAEYSLWSYLIRYERHSHYERGWKGFLYDTVHSFINFKEKTFLTDISPTSGFHMAINNLYSEVNALNDILAFLDSNENATKFIELTNRSIKKRKKGFDFYKIAAFYLYLKEHYSKELTLEKIKEDDSFNALIKSQPNIAASALYLLGITLGYSKINICHYDFLQVPLFSTGQKSDRTYDSGEQDEKNSDTGKESITNHP